MIDRSLGPDLSSMPVDNALNGGQSDSGALEFLRSMQTLEHAEKLVYMLHIEARTVISDKHLDLIVLSIGTANLDLCPSSHPCELDRIGNEVHEDQLQH